MYVANPSEHNFLVSEANKPSILSNILASVLGTLPGFCRKHYDTNAAKEETQTTPEASLINTTSHLDNPSNAKTFQTGNDIDIVADNAI